MNTDQEPTLPPLSTVPSDQHGQIMFVLGQLMGEVKGVQQRQDTTNGKVLKAAADIELLKQVNSTKDGESKGLSKTALVILNVITVLALIISVYLKLTK
jgi:hypothetical protein